MRTFSIYTLGCKVNQYESQQIAQFLEELGLSAVVSGEKPDLAVINTCCVTGTASAKSRQYIQRALKANPAGVRVVCGCLPAMKSRENPPCGDGDNVHIISSRDNLAQSIAQIIIGHNPLIKAKNGLKIKDGMAKFAKYLKLPQLSSFKGHTRAFLKVQDGCDSLCTYCIVPKVRPDVQSKPIGTAISEAKALVAAGHKEIVVTGVNLGAYGRKSVRKAEYRIQNTEHRTEYRGQKTEIADCGLRIVDLATENTEGGRRGSSLVTRDSEMEDGFGSPVPSQRSSTRGRRCASIADLLKELAEIEGLARIRVSSLEPGDISEELLDVFCGHSNIMPHIHLSVQSGASATLKRMCRQYDAVELREKIELIKRRLDRPAITADIIVGFPGETDEDFQQTVELAKWAGFSKIHVFPFSVRAGTAGAKLKGRLPADVIKKRAQILRKVSDELGFKFREQFVGQTCEVLIEGSKDKQAFGHCERYFIVHIEGKNQKKNSIVKVELTKNRDNCVIGIAK
ncbi:MAG: radical SAM protein [Sedimentisphaerales bacterium]|jgi:threonylcarbamoyladenosine tRNA methylthiotransferase MtaB